MRKKRRYTNIETPETCVSGVEKKKMRASE